MRKLCTYVGCREVVDVDPLSNQSPRCEKHPATNTPKRHYDHHIVDGKNIYYTNTWKRLRKAFKAQNPLCVHCMVHDIATPAMDVDHVVELEDGGEPYDWDNLQSLCRSHHNMKSAARRKRRQQIKSQNGFLSLSDF